MKQWQKPHRWSKCQLNTKGSQIMEEKLSQGRRLWSSQISPKKFPTTYNWPNYINYVNIWLRGTQPQMRNLYHTLFPGLRDNHRRGAREILRARAMEEWSSVLWMCTGSCAHQLLAAVTACSRHVQSQPGLNSSRTERSIRPTSIDFWGRESSFS